MPQLKSVIVGEYEISAADVISMNEPWPYEVMVFKKGTRVGLYHAPFQTERDAVAHVNVIENAIKTNSEWQGNVTNDGFGNPLKSNWA